ncbi:hypothetical protein BDP27DRAFT_1323298 [Rhodocollybia butyracea]|uniref:Uncharacterized protein n=1 Tax=Rhodocollybia butyracea TaxID=206335 RepID=A0A9P5PX64_9AGAR|nr:hypothetical protein BDP27DRAFT_1323298 [Rhodocollybia butyracea]
MLVSLSLKSKQPSLDIMQPSRDQQNYEYTTNFLYSNSGRARIARLGYKCLELNKLLGLCDTNEPWTIRADGDGLQYLSVATLPFDAAVKAYLCLQALTSPRQSLSYGQMTFLVTCDVAKLEMLLQRVVDFLQNLVQYLTVSSLNPGIEKQANEICEDLRKVIVLRLDDCYINGYDLQMFRPI